MSGPPEPPASTGVNGAARERTLLAWNRSGLSVLVCIVLLLRHLWPLRGAGQIAALIVIAVAAIFWGLALLAFTLSGGDRDEQPLLTRNVFQLMTVGTVLLAVVGFVLAIVAPP
jgi:uncharacterized membrane protein YidH (DUF202 family)